MEVTQTVALSVILNVYVTEGTAAFVKRSCRLN